jgi:hypothetical protein
MLQFQHRGRVQLNPFFLWIVTHRDIVPECPQSGMFGIERWREVEGHRYSIIGYRRESLRNSRRDFSSSDRDKLTSGDTMLQKRSTVPAWNIGVITTIGSGRYGVIRDALLYADSVHWLSIETIMTALMRPDPELQTECDQEDIEVLRSYDAFKNEIKTCGAEDLIIEYGGEKVVGSEAAQWAIEMLEEERNELIKMLPNIRVLTWANQHQNEASGGWNAYQLAGELTAAMSRLLLPDVSTIPIDAVLDLREHMSDSLNPMRAELLRFTESLRAIVRNNPDAVVFA